MKTKLLFFLMFCAFYAISAFAQIPTPVIGLAFENNVDDQMGTIEPVAYNATYEEDAERGSTVIVFDGVGSGSTTPSAFTGTWVDLTPAVFDYDEVSLNLWFNCNGTVEQWSRLLTLADTTLATADSPTAFIAVNNARGTVVGPDGAAAAQLSYSVGLNDADVIAGREVGAGTIDPDTWYMLTVTHSADEIQIYLDGEFMAEVVLPELLSPKDLYDANTNHCGLATSQWGDPFFYGKMDNFTVYDYILSEDEILELYECTEGCIPSGINELSSYQPFVYSSNGLVHIQNAGNVDISAVEIYNVVGELVYQTNEFHEVISPNLPSSIYIVKIQSNKGDFARKISLFK
jgi:hypothetical protein